MHQRSPIPLFAAACTLLLASIARADDSFLFEGIKYTAPVNGLRDGRLWATLPVGDRLYDLSKVRTISLGNNAKFNDAEAARATDAKKSAAFYKEAIRSLNDPALKLLAEYRAIAPTDADGRWTEAVAYFLDVYAASPVEATWAARPTHLPPAGSSMLKESYDRIQSALKSVKPDDARKNLKNLQLDLLTRAGDTQAAQKLAREIATGVVEDVPKPREPDPAEQANAAVTEIENAIRGKQYDAALKQADALLAAASGENAVQLFQLKARVYEAQNLPDLATATLLRVVAHYPSSPAAPGALLQAAQLQKRANHPAEAKALLGEILSDYPDSREAAIAKTDQ